jgi:hypothetical protein
MAVPLDPDANIGMKQLSDLPTAREPSDSSVALLDLPERNRPTANHCPFHRAQLHRLNNVRGNPFIGLGIVVSGGLYFMGVPNALVWGVLVTALHFVPYFGPVAGSSCWPRSVFSVSKHMKGMPAARLVSPAAPAGIEPHHAGPAGTALHAQSGRQHCFADFLDLALGCARSFVVGAPAGCLNAG